MEYSSAIVMAWFNDRKSGMKKNVTQILNRSLKAVLLSSVLFLAGCATTNNPVDPYEKYNRAMFKFNRSLDYVILRPLADVYGTLVPNPVQAGIGRMFSNFYEPSRVINDILQGEMRYAYQDGARFVLNTTFGLVGFLDVGERVGFPLHQQDFGITMARWGWKQSSFIVMPFIGIYTFRDLVAVPCNVYAFTFWPYIEPENIAWKLYFLEKTETRAALRPADKVIDEAFDPYILVRDAYLQKRENDIKTQSNGRVTSVAPAQEALDEHDKSSQAKDKQENTSAKKGKERQAFSKSKSGKNLPDVISMKKNAHESMS